jgi:hypothetical protein
MVQFSMSGSFDRIDHFLARMGKGSLFSTVDAAARRGVAALAGATPTETGKAASSWDYEIDFSGGDCTIWWTNVDVDDQGTPIVIMLQYGHGTGTGGYVQGRDFINPAIRPIFDEIANTIWREVTS